MQSRANVCIVRVATADQEGSLTENLQQKHSEPSLVIVPACPYFLLSFCFITHSEFRQGSAVQCRMYQCWRTHITAACYKSLKEMWRQMSTSRPPDSPAWGERCIGGRTKPHCNCYLASLHSSFLPLEARVKGPTSGFWRAVLEQPGEGGGMKAEGLCNNSLGTEPCFLLTGFSLGHGTWGDCSQIVLFSFHILSHYFLWRASACLVILFSG